MWPAAVPLTHGVPRAEGGPRVSSHGGPSSAVTYAEWTANTSSASVHLRIKKALVARTARMDKGKRGVHGTCGHRQVDTRASRSRIHSRITLSQTTHQPNMPVMTTGRL